MTYITLEKAGQFVYRYTDTFEVEDVSVFEAAGRVLAEDVLAKISQPPFTRSAVDGYAVKAEDIGQASVHNPQELPVVYKLYAGDWPKHALGTLQSVRIMTGGVVPEGADCVIRQEDTDYGEKNVQIYCQGKKGQNCCFAGEDFREGDILILAGNSLDCYALAAAAAAGREKVSVYKKPRVAVITTGDELCWPGMPLKKGQIYNSSAVYFQSRLCQMGCEMKHVSAVGDDFGRLCADIDACIQNTDLVLTTGGVSVGQKDMLPKVMEEIGADIIFHGLELKPGMPTMFSRYRGVPLLSLSGNPYSAIAVFEILMYSFFAKGYGKANDIEHKKAVAKGGFPKSSPTRRLIRGFFNGTEVTVAGIQGNGQLLSGIGSNCLVDIPAGSGPILPGDRVELIMML